MKFKDWYIWLKHLPWYLKWFPILILVRPVLDNFWFLKDISPFLSPLYLIGVATPILILLSFSAAKFPKKLKSSGDVFFNIWGVLVLINVMILLLIHFNMDLLGNMIKVVTPLMLFFYLRHFVRSRTDINGLLQTILYAAIFPGITLLYELIFNPIIGETLSETRGGGTRLHGGYADIMNYAVYIMGAFIASAYFYLYRRYTKKKIRNDLLKTFGITALCVFGLISIKHTSSWGVFLLLFSIFMLFYLRRSQGVIVVVMLALVIAVIGPRIYESQIAPLVAKEVSVIEGEADVDRSFNGRMTRWKKYFGYWDEMSLGSNMFGVSFSGFKQSKVMVTAAMHSDYIRILFLSGIIGLSFYMLFLLYLFQKRKQMIWPDKFLILAALGTLLLYSVSVTPTFYPILVYMIFPIFAFAALPEKILKRKY